MANAGHPDRSMTGAAQDRLDGPTDGVWHVAVCCITFRRPEGLQRLLDGLNSLAFTKNATPRITVIVVDNDDAAPMRALVDGLRPTFRWQLRYGCEPVQGVSSARNRALEIVPANADYIAFIDDDEVPEPQWLDELLHVQRTYSGAIVQGPVRPVLPESAPKWLVRGRFLELGPFRDGAALHFAYTGNTLMVADIVRKLNLRFDERFNRTGGEDQRFFGRAIAAGYRVVTAARAIVHEWVPEGRTTLRYLLLRKFRMGNTLTLIDRIEGGKGRLTVRAIKSVGRIGLGMAQTILLLHRGFAGLAAALCTVAWGVGALVGLFGVVYREYDAVQAQNERPGRAGPALEPSSRRTNGAASRRPKHV